MIPHRLPARAAAAAILLALAAPALPAPQGAAPPAPASATTVPSPAAPAPRERFAAPDARPFFEKHLPASLLSRGPRGLLWWQWVAIPLLVVLAYVLGSLLGWITRRVLGHLASRTKTEWDDILIAKVAGPLTWMWAIAIVTALHSALLLDDAAIGVLQRVLRAATYLVFFWAGFRSIDVAFAAAGEAPWTKANVGLSGLLPLGRKLGKVILLAIGLVAVLNELGFQVASLLAGLGIGGIAIALAAQKTVEHLFGSVAIGVDQPFRVGDFVKVEDVMGTVETIGMRSTRIRTLDRTLVTFPNGKLADMKTETFAARDRIRLFVNLGLSYETTAAQMRAVLSGIEAALRGHPKLWARDAPSVRFTALNDSTLNVEVVAWFATKDWGEFTGIRQDLFLAFMETVERAGTTFAYPTRTVRLVSEDGAGVGSVAPRS
ncbi:mechanosensitive ion channel family protein [Anaeromyxobacter oryzae]|uniref:Mechanosensitive ion channel protein MscL n=1 Tax=Anaeromyxobacter oryzae TaxID=2918170 RepID=A0ABN6MUI4_9BACT|nr:mechanosensitive ion channel family protein [Anaeromyxobacter oryzae]BDG04595.1 mechanosensitive ion channel protein MscL [Anaeromyxobacter oryzae]